MECEEMHCSGAARTHQYGDPSCDWALDPKDGVIGNPNKERPASA